MAPGSDQADRPEQVSRKAEGLQTLDRARQKLQVDRNYDAFVLVLGDILPDHRDEYALMRDGGIVDFFDKPGDAYRAGIDQFPDRIFSIQEVTDEPIDLGFFSHI